MKYHQFLFKMIHIFILSLKYNKELIFSNNDLEKKFAYLNLKEVNKIEFNFNLLLDFNFYIKYEIFNFNKNNFITIF